MSKDEVIALLGGWEGRTLGTVGRVEVGPDDERRQEVHLELLPVRDHPRLFRLRQHLPLDSRHDRAVGR